MRLFYILFITLCVPCSCLCTNKIDSLTYVLESQLQEKNYTEGTYTYFHLAEAYKLHSFDTVLMYYERASSLTKNEQLDSLYYISLYKRGRFYANANKISKALALLSVVTEEGESVFGYKKYTSILNKTSYIYTNVGRYQDAVGLLMKSLQISERMHDTLGIMESYYYLGATETGRERLEQALVYHKKGLEFARLSNKKNRWITTFLNGIGSAYVKNDKPDTAIIYFEELIRNAEEFDSEIDAAYGLLNLGVAYNKKKEYKKAIACIKKIRIPKGNRKSLDLGILLYTGGAYYGLAQYQKAFEILSEAKELATKIKADPKKLEILKLLGETAHKINKSEETYTYLQDYIKLREEIFDNKSQKQIDELKIQYNVDRREQQHQMEQSLLLKDRKAARHYMYGAILGMILLAILLWTISSRYSIVRIAKSKLEATNQEIELANTNLAIANGDLEEANQELAITNLKLSTTNTELENVNMKLEELNDELEVRNRQIKEQNIALGKSNKALENFAYIISHDLKEPLRMVESYSQLLNRRYGTKLDKGAQDFFGYILDATKRMKQLMGDLLEHSRLNNNKLKLEPVHTAKIVDAVVITLREQIDRAGAIVVFGKLPTIQANNSQMYQLFQNLITNALKFHKDGNPKVEISCQMDMRGIYTFCVEDNGIGIDPLYQEKIFALFQRLHSREEFEGTGIGLANCKQIVENHKGKIWVESMPNEGAKFYFTLPALQKTEKTKELGMEVSRISKSISKFI